jgi:hypothetical protein
MSAMIAGYIEPAPDKLTLHEQFRLLEIAHETSDYELKKLALNVLGRFLSTVHLHIMAK